MATLEINNQILFVSALPQELKALKEEIVSEVRFHKPPITAWSGHVNDQEVILLCGGCGEKYAIQAGEFIVNNFKPKIVVNIGYAGGAHPDLANGDMVISSTIYSPSGESIELDENIKNLARTVATSAVLKYKECNTVTVPDLITKPEDKAMWGTRYNAKAIDMETFYLASICKKNNIPFLAVRVILDPMSFKLPNDSMLRNDGTMLWGNIIKMAIKQPFTLFRLAGKQSFADEMLGKFTTTILPLVSSIDFTKPEKEIKEAIKIATQSIN